MSLDDSVADGPPQPGHHDADPQPAKSEGTAPQEPATRADDGVQPGRWVKRAVLVVVLLVGGYIAYRVSAAFFPRWWAQRVADQVDGRISSGVLWGMFYGFLFSFVPMLVLAQARRSIFGWVGRIVVVLVAIVLATPNWLTLSVVAGNSNAAHAGERIMDVDAPGFRAATLASVILGVALALLVSGMSMVMKHRKKQLVQLRSERDEMRRYARDAQEPGQKDD